MLALNLAETLSQQRARAGRIGGAKIKHGRSAADRFWSKVDQRGECWTWCAAVGRDGYGRFRLAGRQEQASRAAFVLTHGPIPSGMMVLHHCDNPRCVRPDHLFLGTARDNAADRDEKGRCGDFRGEGNGGAHLDGSIVLRIRDARARGASAKEIGAEFGVSPRHVRQIASRQRWPHLCEPPTREPPEE